MTITTHPNVPQANITASVSRVVLTHALPRAHASSTWRPSRMQVAGELPQRRLEVVDLAVDPRELAARRDPVGLELFHHDPPGLLTRRWR